MANESITYKKFLEHKEKNELEDISDDVLLIISAYQPKTRRELAEVPQVDKNITRKNSHWIMTILREVEDS